MSGKRSRAQRQTRREQLAANQALLEMDGLDPAHLNVAAVLQLRRHVQQEELVAKQQAHIDRFRQQLSILENERVTEAVRELLIPVAARVLFATAWYQQQIITREALATKLGDPPLHRLQSVLGFLSEKPSYLIGRRQSLILPDVRGYHAKAPLYWAVNNHQHPALEAEYAAVVREEAVQSMLPQRSGE